jgi:general secretion pathway protein K
MALGRARARQRGVALITVLLVFALATVIATEMLRRSQLGIRSFGNIMATRQAYYYALGGETFARQLLTKDVLDGLGGVDHLQEPWARTSEQPAFEIESGSMSVAIRDMQGRFNLNSVVDAAGATSQQGFGQLQALLASLHLNASYASEWLDWIDAGQTPSPNGAEDADYPKTRTADRPESDTSALRQLRSMKSEDYARLAPHVTVLPKLMPSAQGQLVPVVAPLNVNTADASTLRAILGQATAALVLARQKSGGYKSAADLPPGSGGAGQVDVKSSFFEILVTVNYDNRWQRLRTMVWRDSQTGVTTVLSRARSPLSDDDDEDRSEQP